MENKHNKHKCRKRAARSLFDRRKTHVKRSSLALLQPPSSNSNPSAPSPHVLPPSSHIPEHWQVFSEGGDTNYHWVENTINHGYRIRSCITIHNDRTWSVFAYGTKIPTTNTVLQQFPHYMITSSDTVIHLIGTVNTACICPGNPDEKFVEICTKRGGTIKVKEDLARLLPLLTTEPVRRVRQSLNYCWYQGLNIGHSTCNYIITMHALILLTGVSTVHTTSCTILTEKGRCKFCSTFRSTLRSCVSREQNNTTDTTVANSHAKFSTLYNTS